MSSSGKRKSRWGTRPNDSNSGVDASPSRGTKVSVAEVGGVSEADAIAALLSDAQKSKDAKLPPPPKQHRQGNNRSQRDSTSSAGGGNSHHGRRNDGGPAIVEDETKEIRKKRKRSRWGDEPDDAETPSSEKWGNQEEEEKTTEKEVPKEKQKANFGLSGALATDDQHGNVYNGVLLKFSEPPEARVPNTRWRLYVFRAKQQQGKKDDDEENDNDEPIDILHISKQSAYLFGRETRVADIPVHHPSLSKQHAVLQYRAVLDSSSGKMLCRPYIMDLGSTNGTFLNGVKIGEARYYELRKGDVVRLGHSSREYVLLTENTTGVAGG